MRKPFKLKSGNISGGSSFKAMGATPGESPTKIRKLKRAWNIASDWITGTPSTKTIAKSDKTKKSVSKVKSKVTKDPYKKEANVEDMVETIVNQSKKRNIITRGGKTIRNLFIADQLTGGHGTEKIKNILVPEVEVTDEYTGDDPKLKQKFKTVQKRKEKKINTDSTDVIEVQ